MAKLSDDSSVGCPKIESLKENDEEDPNIDFIAN